MGMRHSSRLFATLLHTFCVLALAISCGLPEALHDFGHALTSTSCESALPAQPNSATASTDACWIQSLIASVSQFSARASAVPSINSSSQIAKDVSLPFTTSLVSH